MVVTEKTKISAILKANEKAIEVIASINTHFRKLKNPILRKLLASQVTVEQAARIGNTTSTVILNKLKEINFEVILPCMTESENKFRVTREVVDPSTLKTLDVREMLSNGKDPFSWIMKEIKNLSPEQTLLIINSFEPIPLINILTQKGYISWTDKISNQLFKTYFKPTSTNHENIISEEVEQKNIALVLKKLNKTIKEIDVRDLEMPYPMITILNELTELKFNEVLLVNHKKIPMLLLPKLKDLEFRYEIEKLSEEYTRMIIYKDQS